MYVCVYIYIYIIIIIIIIIIVIIIIMGILRFKNCPSRGNQGGPKEWGLRVTTGLIAFLSRLFVCSNPRVERCSNPLPWDPLGSPVSPGVLFARISGDGGSSGDWSRLFWRAAMNTTIFVRELVVLQILESISGNKSQIRVEDL